ncbi:hypothetical protein FHT67_003714 [Paenibacillus sp. BK720]|nr:hypothetical protein [Paenibacillus sp. BK720]
MLEEITEQAFREMTPKEVMDALEFTDEVCDQLILLTYRYIMDFYRKCRMDSKSMATIVDDKIKKMLQQTIVSILLKEDNFHRTDRYRTEILSAMTGSAIYGATFHWLTVGENDQTDLLLNIVRPYVMNSLKLNGNNGYMDENNGCHSN